MGGWNALGSFEYEIEWRWWLLFLPRPNKRPVIHIWPSLYSHTGRFALGIAMQVK